MTHPHFILHQRPHHQIGFYIIEEAAQFFKHFKFRVVFFYLFHEIRNIRQMALPGQSKFTFINSFVCMYYAYNRHERLDLRTATNVVSVGTQEGPRPCLPFSGI